MQNSDYTYGFTAKDSATLFIEIGSEVKYKSSFTIDELNNLMDCFKEVLTSSLLLRDHDLDFIRTTSQLGLKTLKCFEDPKAVLKYLESQSGPSNVKFIIISMNLDLIILLHKLSKLVSCEYRKALYSGLLKTPPSPPGKQ